MMMLHLECRRCSEPGRTPGDIYAADSDTIPASSCAAAHSGHISGLVCCKLSFFKLPTSYCTMQLCVITVLRWNIDYTPDSDSISLIICVALKFVLLLHTVNNIAKRSVAHFPVLL